MKSSRTRVLIICSVSIISVLFGWRYFTQKDILFLSEDISKRTISDSQLPIILEKESEKERIQHILDQYHYTKAFTYMGYANPSEQELEIRKGLADIDWDFMLPETNF